MSRATQVITQACRACGASAFAFALWTLWLALGLGLVVQAFIASRHELAVPDFLLRRAEREFAAAGLRASFARTLFDPTGRVLIEDVRLSLPEFAEPVVTAHAVYFRLNPWALALGRFEPREIRVTGASVAVPAMLSPSGRPAEIVRDLDATLLPDEKQIAVPHLSARFAGVTLSVRGAVSTAGFAGGPPVAGSFAGLLTARFPALCRQALALSARLEALEAPALQVELAPSDTRLAIATATLFARGLTLTAPRALQLRDLRARTRLPLRGAAPTTSRIELEASEVHAPPVALDRVRAVVRGRFRPGGLEFDPHDVQLTTDRLAAAGFTAEGLSAWVTPQPLPQLEAEIAASVLGAPLAVHGAADVATRRAIVRFAGTVSPDLLDPLGARLGIDVRKYFSFGALTCDHGEVRLGPDWKFERLAAHVAVRDIDAYRVRIDGGSATIEFDGRRFHSPDAYARIGENQARGSYTQDLRTREYRFLLDGRLRPLAIAGWFQDWWPRFFAQLEFPAAPPEASVDVAGIWREGRRSTVFVAADAVQPVVRGAVFDRVRTRLFIRPTFFDGLAATVIRAEGEARGTFVYLTDPETRGWRTLELDLVSAVAPAVAVQVMGPLGERIFAPFTFARPPRVKLHGRFDSAAAPGGEHTELQLEAQTTGEFRFHDFPLHDLSLTAAIRDNETLVDNVSARFAAGAVTGRAKVWGAGAARRVGFDVALKDARLGQAVTVLQDFFARLHGHPVAPPGKFVQEKANVRLDLAASAEGGYNDPFSYHGTGNAVLQGTEIGEVPLLGLLSDLLKFTALRFTSARTNFKIDGAKLTFPDFTLRGANSAIDAHGDYALDRSQLDFRAKIFPFQESGNLLKNVVGAVLTPFSNVFEVKLTGSLEKPEWSFVMGPTNFLRSLAPDEPEPAKPAAAPAITETSTPLASPGTPNPATTPPREPLPSPPPPAPPAAPKP